MKRRHWFCTSAIVLCFAAKAATLNVPSQFLTIQAAVDAANSGDQVLVAPGIYTEAVHFKGKGILIASEAGPEVTIIDHGTSRAAFTANQSETAASEVRGFTLRAGADAIYAAFSAPTVSTNIILNCSIGVEAYFASPVVRGNRFISCGKALHLGGASTPLVEGNLITDCFGEAAIYMFAAGDPVIQNNVIRNNRTVAIAMVNRSDANITQNVIVQNSTHGIIASVPSGARGPVIRHNTIADNGPEAGAQITFTGFYADSVVANNIISGRYGIAFDTSYGTYRPTLQYNDVFSPGGFHYTGGVSDQTGINGNISNLPLFLNPSLFDYQLQAGSPGIDDASASDMVTPDAVGVPRPVEGDGPQPNAPDMGAFEYVPGPPRPVTLLSVQSTQTGATITWTPFDGSTLYQLRRSTTSGGPYGPVVSTAATNYLDENAPLYVTNYYVVAGSNAFGLGPISQQIAIRTGNRPPATGDDTATLDEDNSTSIPLLANDSDPDGDSISVSVLSVNPPAETTISPQGTLNFRPAQNYFGTTILEYRASDPFGASSTGRVSIVVRPVDDPPTAQISSWFIPSGANATIFLSGEDVDSTNLSFIVTQEAQHGISLPQASARSIWYQAAHGFFGTDTIRFVVSDGKNLSGESFAVVQVPAPLDLDDDGMADWWENLHDLNSPAGDRDGDGVFNVFEYRANTSPNDPTSLLKIDSVRRESLGTRVSWSSIGGVRYRVLSSDDLNFPFQPIERPASLEIDHAAYGFSSINSFLDMRGGPATGARFYRVQVLNQ